jgi:hypothetical protein
MTFDVNVKGTFPTVRKALPLLDDGASILMISSATSTKGASGMGAYAASRPRCALWAVLSPWSSLPGFSRERTQPRTDRHRRRE